MLSGNLGAGPPTPRESFAACASPVLLTFPGSHGSLRSSQCLALATGAQGVWMHLGALQGVPGCPVCSIPVPPSGVYPGASCVGVCPGTRWGAYLAALMWSLSGRLVGGGGCIRSAAPGVSGHPFAQAVEAPPAATPPPPARFPAGLCVSVCPAIPAREAARVPIQQHETRELKENPGPPGGHRLDILASYLGPRAWRTTKALRQG